MQEAPLLLDIERIGLLASIVIVKDSLIIYFLYSSLEILIHCFHSFLDIAFINLPDVLINSLNYSNILRSLIHVMIPFTHEYDTQLIYYSPTW